MKSKRVALAVLMALAALMFLCPAALAEGLTILDEAAILEYGDYASGFREHGYLIHEKLVSNYFPGFGEAACVLKYGEDWMPEPSSESSEPAQPPIEQSNTVLTIVPVT